MKNRMNVSTNKYASIHFSPPWELNNTWYTYYTVHVKFTMACLHIHSCVPNPPTCQSSRRPPILPTLNNCPPPPCRARRLALSASPALSRLRLALCILLQSTAAPASLPQQLSVWRFVNASLAPPAYPASPFPSSLEQMRRPDHDPHPFYPCIACPHPYYHYGQPPEAS